MAHKHTSCSCKDTAIGLLRILMGWTFLWAFLDKLFGFGFATASERAWLNGGSPTAGFLKNAPHGPLADFYTNMAGSVFVDWLFMVGLLLLGLALLLGIGIRIAGVAGATLMFLMFFALLPPENNPLIDEHVIYATLLISFIFLDAGQSLGLGKWWSSTALVKKYTFLK